MSEGVRTGMLATNLGGVPELAIKMGAKHPSRDGRLLGEVVEGERDDLVGKFVTAAGVVPW